VGINRGSGDREVDGRCWNGAEGIVFEVKFNNGGRGRFSLTMSLAIGF
jgi:hypothetical protein